MTTPGAAAELQAIQFLCQAHELHPAAKRRAGPLGRGHLRRLRGAAHAAAGAWRPGRTTSLIRNYLGFPRGISGRELALQASEQAIMFGAELVAQPATALRTDAAGRVMTLEDGSQVVSRAVTPQQKITMMKPSAQQAAGVPQN